MGVHGLSQGSLYLFILLPRLREKVFLNVSRFNTHSENTLKFQQAKLDTITPSLLFFKP
jgi:hypothetical protein